MNTATAPSTPAPTMMPLTPRTDDAWWIELFGWQAACEEAEPSDERLMRQASLLALLSVA